jgi:hypothetical protein
VVLRVETRTTVCADKAKILNNYKAIALCFSHVLSTWYEIIGEEIEPNGFSPLIAIYWAGRKNRTCLYR